MGTMDHDRLLRLHRLKRRAKRVKKMTINNPALQESKHGFPQDGFNLIRGAWMANYDKHYWLST